METKLNKKQILSSDKLKGFTESEKKDFEKLIDQYNSGNYFENHELVRIKRYTDEWNSVSISLIN